MSNDIDSYPPSKVEDYIYYLGCWSYCDPAGKVHARSSQEYRRLLNQCIGLYTLTINQLLAIKYPDPRDKQLLKMAKVHVGYAEKALRGIK